MKLTRVTVIGASQRKVWSSVSQNGLIAEIWDDSDDGRFHCFLIDSAGVESESLSFKFLTDAISHCVDAVS